MNLPITGKINDSGHLEIGGCDVTDLVNKYGTPLYVLDEEEIRQNCRSYRTLLNEEYQDSDIIYASKALSTIGVLKVIASEGVGVDVSSGGELYTALKAGFDPKKIYFHGNNKSIQEIEEGVSASVGRFVVDNLEEIKNLEEAASRKKKKIEVLIRVNPGVEAHTHDAIKTGQTDSKFGISKDKVLDTVKQITLPGSLSFIGLHAHIGSQIFDAKGYLEEIDVMLDIAKEIKDKLNIDVKELNLGGGIGIAYVEGDTPVTLERFISEISQKVKTTVAKHHLMFPKLIFEPGRSLVGRAGVTLYTVGHIKEIAGIRKYIIVDGGMSDNIRPMLYGAKYEFAVADNMKARDKEKVTIAGRFCESGDVLAKDIMLPKVNKGSIVAVFCTGAYNYSMASNYNRVPRPAMVMVANGKVKLVVKRETYKEITSCDIA